MLFDKSACRLLPLERCPGSFYCFTLPPYFSMSFYNDVFGEQADYGAELSMFKGHALQHCNFYSFSSGCHRHMKAENTSPWYDCMLLSSINSHSYLTYFVIVIITK